MQDIRFNIKLDIVVGFRVYDGAEDEISEKGESEPIEIIIPFNGGKERKVLTRRIKKQCESGSTNPACQQCQAK